MQILQLLWKLLRTYFHYRKGMKAIRTGVGVAQSQDVMMKAYRKGDYQTAAFRAADPFLQACMFVQMGQFGAAQPLLKHSIENAQNPQLGALANNLMGQALLEEKHYDKAQECFRTARMLWQQRGGGDRGMAEVLLRRGGDSAEALRLARSGLEKERAHPGLSADSKISSLCEQMGTAAWAEAVGAHDATAVDRLVAEGEALKGAIPVCCIAQMHLHFGHAYAVLGNAAQSARHYEEAARIDPNGLAGRAAASIAVSART